MTSDERKRQLAPHSKLQPITASITAPVSIMQATAPSLLHCCSLLLLPTSFCHHSQTQQNKTSYSKLRSTPYISPPKFLHIYPQWLNQSPRCPSTSVSPPPVAWATTSTPQAAAPRSPRSNSRVRESPPLPAPIILTRNPQVTSRAPRPRSRASCPAAKPKPRRRPRNGARRPAPSSTMLYVS